MSAVHVAIAARFCAPEWATFFEVSNAAGFARSRSADAIAMNLWPSRGLAVHGFEVKVSRSDWLRELKDPAKAEPILKFCDRWWLAVADDSIARADEVPATWGLLVLRGKKLVQEKEAPSLQPEPLSRGFIAAILRRASEASVPKSQLHGLIEEQVNSRMDRERETHSLTLSALQGRYDAIASAVAEFERASGIRIRADRFSDSPRRLGEAARVLLEGGADKHIANLEKVRGHLTALARDTETALAALKAVDADTKGAA